MSDANAEYNAAYDHGFRAGEAMAENRSSLTTEARIVWLEAQIQEDAVRFNEDAAIMEKATVRIEALKADGREATRLLDLWSEIPGAEDFAPYQDTMTFLGKPNSVGWVWAREVREERDFDKEQSRQRDLAMQCVCEAEEREQAAHARIEALKAALRFIADGYDNHDVNHADYRLKVYQVALDALAPESTDDQHQRTD